jgi:hypothetical protein
MKFADSKLVLIGIQNKQYKVSAILSMYTFPTN